MTYSRIIDGKIIEVLDPNRVTPIIEDGEITGYIVEPIQRNVEDTVEWLNQMHFARSGEGVEHNATKDAVTTTHYTFSERLTAEGTMATERTSERTHPFDEKCADCERLDLSS